jgi:hypothetical protein
VAQPTRKPREAVRSVARPPTLMSTQRFNPIGSRVSILAAWTLMSAIPFGLTFVLYITGTTRVIVGVVTLLASIGLEVLGISRCLQLQLEFSDDEIRYRNIFGSGSYAWDQITDVTLRRYMSTRSVDHQLTAQMPRGLVGGLRPPAVAFRLNDNQLSPPITITACLGVKKRSRLIELLESYGSPHHVNVKITNRRPSWPGGAAWDMRVGKGLKP